jgi:hypothetical protein
MVTAAAVRGGFALGRDRQVAAHVRLVASQGAEGKAPGGPAVAGDPRYGGPRRVAGPVRSSEPAHGRSQAYRGSFSVARRGFPRSRPRWLAARAALTAPLRIPGTSGRCRRSPSGSLAPAGGYAEGLWCSAVQAHGCRASGCIFTRRLRPGCSVLPRHGPIRGGCRASRPVRPLSCLDGNGGGDPRGARPGGPGEVGAAVRLEAAHEPRAEAPARTGPQSRH